MEKKDLFFLIIAFFGWAWGIIQFIVNRQNQKKDKLIDRKYESYSNYLKKSDSLMTNLRTNPDMIYGISSDFIADLLSNDEDRSKKGLIKFNEKIIEFIKKGTEPVLILRNELNSLILICSEELRTKINEMNHLVSDFNEEMVRALNEISLNNSSSIVRELSTIEYKNRWERFTSLNNEIIDIMRKEIGNK